MSLTVFSGMTGFQSTHPRGVRRAGLLDFLRFLLVSIHAPAWGATFSLHVPVVQFPVSIHAPAWGATTLTASTTHQMAPFQSTHPRGVRHLPTAFLYFCAMFQSTHPRGVRLCQLFKMDRNSPVSIHAPAWGATGPSLQQSAILQSFNPRTRVGCDVRHLCQSLGIIGFNPRTRVGCDPRSVAESLSVSMFQSTHPRGVRPAMSLRHTAGVLVSIHAPAWGATGRIDARFASRFVSIHAPAWGATAVDRERRAERTGFNPRTRVGCDVLLFWLWRGQVEVSIHAPAWGATAFNTPVPLCVSVSIHAPAWGATQMFTPRNSWGMFQSTHPRGVRLFPCFIQ